MMLTCTRCGASMVLLWESLDFQLCEVCGEMLPTRAAYGPDYDILEIASEDQPAELGAGDAHLGHHPRAMHDGGGQW